MEKVTLGVDIPSQPALYVETHQEILNLIAWAAFLVQTIPSCKRTFEDLIERLVQTGPLFASLAKENQGHIFNPFLCNSLLQCHLRTLEVV